MVRYELVSFEPEIQGLGTGMHISAEIKIRTSFTDANNVKTLSFVSSGDSQRTSNYDLAFDAGKWAGKNPFVLDLEKVSRKAISEALENIANTLATSQLATTEKGGRKQSHEDADIPKFGEDSIEVETLSLKHNCRGFGELIETTGTVSVYKVMCRNKKLVYRCINHNCQLILNKQVR
ncbi:MAG: hypothetical protein DIZ77_08265 [endosymbiont of Seepiophila jonesi]|uniref:Uncharacterized protein n=1 Tax=endosymbiont of Lamellibrachia luymesi TaxID=2200907 RepID=A0A370DPU7_9GAMM|nr:MAG: hypothetical protein DIZ79_15675 [endosymbiont of Lamellibrachia luymesi]RDH92476.1 MAG: hypothetical protein DIZ77_08265 [endosymbiont of Seepiophila jonesi]